jgi:hypothetical protein
MVVLVALLAISGGAQGGRPSLGGNASKAGAAAAAPYSNTYSVNFDGTGDYVDLGQPADLDGAFNAREITVSFWAKRTDGNTRISVSRHYSGAPAPHFMTDIESGPGAFFYAGTGSSTGTAAAAAPTANVWHHYAARVIDTAGVKKARLFIDGAAVGSDVNAGSQTSAVKWLIGCRWTGLAMAGVDLCWSGRIDEVAFWSAGLSNAEITELYNGGASKDLSTHSRYSVLLHWYRMGDGDTLPTITDRKGSQNGTSAGDASRVADAP